VDEAYYNGSGWSFVTLGHGMSAGTSAGVVRNAGLGKQWVYYVYGGSVEESYYLGATWYYLPLHNGIMGSPAVALDSTGSG
jgi:hypothetical protein